ncbi:MAG: phosphoenolpyruvate--protein phosphotransferase [Elusimicrobia bacterium]|nr:phosphoenolpyruvate--protein phosphotransferase [Elusimicrobiota bacterium]
MIIIKGIPASPGVAIGKVYLFEEDEIAVEKINIPEHKIRAEVKRFKEAVKKTGEDLGAAEAKVLHMLGRQHARLIDAHRLMLTDPLITEEVPGLIIKEKINKLDDEFFKERRHDLFDVGKRLLRNLVKQEKKLLSDIKGPTILVAHNLYPSDTLHLKEVRVLGFCTDIGGKTSHTALLAQGMELPAVVGLTDITRQVRNGDTIIIDGEQGIVIISPAPEALGKYQKKQHLEREAEKFLEKVKNLPAVTLDGKKIEVAANLDALEDPQVVAALLPQGLGLVRTESLYMNRSSVPSEEEHYKAYTHILKTFAPSPVVIRLADIGGDKLTELGIEGHEKEANPFMGLRGIRLFLKHPDLMKTQLRAMLRASVAGKMKIMIPMLSSASEVLTVRRMMSEISTELAKSGAAANREIELGIMVEIPAAAVTLDSMLGEIDFVSIGTNDLIQYTLAVDRINQHVAHIYDSYHPAVLRMIHLTVQTAHKKGKPVSICGEMASDPKSIALLIGLGVDTLSVTSRMFLRVKHTVRSLDFEKCARLAQGALSAATCEEVRDLVLHSTDENP